MIIKKLKYGINRVAAEFSGKEDYFHPNLPASNPDDIAGGSYYLDMTVKGHFDGEFEDGIPVLLINGQRVLFYIFLFNYGLGLIGRAKKGDDVTDALKTLVDFVLKNQEESGAWVNDFGQMDFALSGKTVTGMGQGLGISFLVRCCELGLIEKVACSDAITKAKSVMLSPSHTDYKFECKVIEEFFTLGTTPLNGFIFALWGLYDWCKWSGNMEEFDFYNSQLLKILSHYMVPLNWSYYSLDKSYASPFYQKLHIAQMKAMHIITNEKKYAEVACHWRKGLKNKGLFILLKSLQKLQQIKTMPMNK